MAVADPVWIWWGGAVFASFLPTIYSKTLIHRYGSVRGVFMAGLLTFAVITIISLFAKVFI